MTRQELIDANNTLANMFSESTEKLIEAEQQRDLLAAQVGAMQEMREVFKAETERQGCTHSAWPPAATLAADFVARVRAPLVEALTYGLLALSDGGDLHRAAIAYHQHYNSAVGIVGIHRLRESINKALSVEEVKP